MSPQSVENVERELAADLTVRGKQSKSSRMQMLPQAAEAAERESAVEMAVTAPIL